jgi:hypothetical protein
LGLFFFPVVSCAGDSASVAHTAHARNNIDNNTINNGRGEKGGEKKISHTISNFLWYEEPKADFKL